MLNEIEFCILQLQIEIVLLKKFFKSNEFDIFLIFKNKNWFPLKEMSS